MSGRSWSVCSALLNKLCCDPGCWHWHSECIWWFCIDIKIIYHDMSKCTHVNQVESLKGTKKDQQLKKITDFKFRYIISSQWLPNDSKGHAALLTINKQKTIKHDPSCPLIVLLSLERKKNAHYARVKTRRYKMLSPLSCHVNVLQTTPLARPEVSPSCSRDSWWVLVQISTHLVQCTVDTYIDSAQ